MTGHGPHGTAAQPVSHLCNNLLYQGQIVFCLAGIVSKDTECIFIREMHAGIQKSHSNRAGMGYVFRHVPKYVEKAAPQREAGRIGERQREAGKRGSLASEVETEGSRPAALVTDSF